jgi:hypothetical protein
MELGETVNNLKRKSEKLYKFQTIFFNTEVSSPPVYDFDDYYLIALNTISLKRTTA